MKQFESDSANVRIPKGYSINLIKMYFWIGVISAILLRAIIIADHYSGFVARVLWYAGVVGYLLFFSHRYDIAKRRVGVIKNLSLLEKIQTREPLQEKDFEGLNYIMWSLSVSRERLNYLVIFAFSIIAIILSLLLDLGIVEL
ncbi:MAG: hypothetical protein JXA38_06445 [Methanosarcinaceae archaeon]|nr:hypothetical protein [Methanosarcinaceae archaeon]